jgi:hypothetical protein
VEQMRRLVWELCGKIICTKAVLLIIRIYIIWINVRNERTCYLIYWTALIHHSSIHCHILITCFIYSYTSAISPLSPTRHIFQSTHYCQILIRTFSPTLVCTPNHILIRIFYILALLLYC